jgi:hypothetical protein
VSYDQLCQKIKEQSPYGVNNVVVDVGNAEFDGMTINLDENGVMTETSATLSDQEQHDCVWWYFKGEAHRHPKVMKVPVTFVRNGQPIQAHILIGWGGPGV